MIKFGHPATVVGETDRWCVQIRPKQPGFGSLVLICKEEASAFGALSPAAFAELGRVVASLEPALKRLAAYDKINYLMLMMVDPDVHFHVIPRHETPRAFAGLSFTDAGWPGPPALGEGPELDADAIAALKAALSELWTAP
jgi:diadenosine tetraphosphate (Ap4A) HIT family hydrolase